MSQQFISTTTTRALYNSAESFELIVIDSPKCYAVISLYGGQILEFNAKGKPPLLWLSPKVEFKPGKAIRGGVPICAPWFGPHKNNKQDGVTYPNHGFARTSVWQRDNQRVDNDDVLIQLSFSSNELTKKIFPYHCSMTINFVLSDDLKIQFEVVNHSEQVMPCEWALHSYFSVDNIDNVGVDGLSQAHFIDSANHNVAGQLIDQQTFGAQVDRYFVRGGQQQVISGKSPIDISGTQCDSVITWNPGVELAEKMTDIGAENYHQFVCVERGAIFENQWNIPPQQRKMATMVLSNVD